MKEELQKSVVHKARRTRLNLLEHRETGQCLNMVMTPTTECGTIPVRLVAILWADQLKSPPG